MKCFLSFISLTILNGVIVTVTGNTSPIEITPSTQTAAAYAKPTAGTFTASTFSYPQNYPAVSPYYASASQVSPVVVPFPAQGQGQIHNGQIHNGQIQQASYTFASPVTHQQAATRSDPAVAASGYTPSVSASGYPHAPSSGHQNTVQSHGQSSASSAVADPSTTTSELSKHDDDNKLSSLLLELIALVILPLIFIPSFIFVLIYLWQFFMSGGHSQYPSGDEYFSVGPFGIGQLHKKNGMASHGDLLKEKADELIARVLPHI